MATMGTAAALFAALLTEGPQSRTALAGRLGISAAAVTRAAGPLLDAGYLTVPARPAGPLAIRSGREFFVGVTVTATELVGAVCDLTARPHLIERRALRGVRVPEVLDDLEALAGTMLSRGGYRSRTRHLGLAVSDDVLAWREVPWGDRVAQRTGLTVTISEPGAASTWFGVDGSTAHGLACAAAAASVQLRVLGLIRSDRV